MKDTAAWKETAVAAAFLPWHHPRTWAITIGFGMLMTLGYVAVTMTQNSERDA